MSFSPNNPDLFVLVAIVIAFVIGQSIFFTARAWRRGKSLGISTDTMRRTVVSSAVFSVAPALSILLGIFSLSKFLGFALPWLRLSVIGAITYELPAASAAAAATGTSMSETVSDPSVFAVIAWVMTLGIIPSLILVPIFGKKIESGLIKLKNKDSRWGGIFMDALFLGMISAFLGMIFADVGEGLRGWVPVFVMLSSSILMIICGLFVKKYDIRWVKDFAMPISMIGSMILAIPITALVNMVTV